MEREKAYSLMMQHPSVDFSLSLPNMVLGKVIKMTPYAIALFLVSS